MSIPLEKEVASWTSSLVELGAVPSAAHVFAKGVENLYLRLSVPYPALKPRQVFQSVFSGLLSSGLPFFSPERINDRVQADGLVEAAQLTPLIAKEFATVFSSAGRLHEQLQSALLAREQMSTELNEAVSALQLFLTQQHQVLRKNYPFTADDAISTELLGTRFVQENLGDDILPRIYAGLDEIVRALRTSGNWMTAWDGMLAGQMTLVQTRVLFTSISKLMTVLDDEAQGPIKRLFRLRWTELDGRMLAALESKWAWRPLA